MNGLAELADAAVHGGLAMSCKSVSVLRALVLAHRHSCHIPASSIVQTECGGFSVMFEQDSWTSWVDIASSGAITAEAYRDGAFQFAAGFSAENETDMPVIADTVLGLFATQGGGVYEQA